MKELQTLTYKGPKFSLGKMGVFVPTTCKCLTWTPTLHSLYKLSKLSAAQEVEMRPWKCHPSSLQKHLWSIHFQGCLNILYPGNSWHLHYLQGFILLKKKGKWGSFGRSCERTWFKNMKTSALFMNNRMQMMHERGIMSLTNNWIFL